MNFNDMKLTTENTENTEQDTPETDEVRRATDCNALGYGLMKLHACKLERERDEARELLRILAGLVAYGLGQSGEEWSLEAIRQATNAIQNAKFLEEAK